MKLGRDLQTVARPKLPLGLGPFISLLDGHNFRQVQSTHAGYGFGCRYRLVDDRRAYRFPKGQGQDATILRTVHPQVARQLAGINASDRHDAFLLQILSQCHGCAKVRSNQRQVFNNEPGCVHRAGLNVFGIDSVIANVGISQCDDLLAVARVREDFLIASH